MNIIAETNRLVIREFSLEDAPNFFALNNDPQVMRHTGDKKFASVEEAENLVKNYIDYKKNGFGRNTLIEKETGSFVGWCGLKRHPNGEVDLGYRLMRSYWNQGFATESSLKIMDIGFSLYGLEQIVGHVSPQNLPSIRVLEKCGFRFVKQDKYDEFEKCLFYSLKKEEFYAGFSHLS